MENYCIKVKASKDCYIADVDGDPGRTLLKSNAKVFTDETTALKECESLRKQYPNRSFTVEYLDWSDDGFKGENLSDFMKNFMKDFHSGFKDEIPDKDVIDCIVQMPFFLPGNRYFLHSQAGRFHRENNTFIPYKPGDGYPVRNHCLQFKDIEAFKKHLVKLLPWD